VELPRHLDEEPSLTAPPVPMRRSEAMAQRNVWGNDP
jgi:hypothetical protein